MKSDFERYSGVVFFQNDKPKNLYNWLSQGSNPTFHSIYDRIANELNNEFGKNKWDLIYKNNKDHEYMKLIVRANKEKLVNYLTKLGFSEELKDYSMVENKDDVIIGEPHTVLTVHNYHIKKMNEPTFYEENDKQILGKYGIRDENEEIIECLKQ